MINIMLVAGARPNFMKIMPLIRAFRKYRSSIKYSLVHTGQHYDKLMSDVFFSDFDLPKPGINLGIGSGPHGRQTARVMEAIEKILLRSSFNLVVVVGDVNSTLAAALAASKLHIKIAHVEAGLRSFDKNMPEEINRLLTDHISDYLFTTESYANTNLLREGIDSSKIFLVGDTMVDAFYICKTAIGKSRILKDLGLKNNDYAVATVHRPSNVDCQDNLKKIVDILNSAAKAVKIIFPMHPRTKKMMAEFGFKLNGVISCQPLGYVDFHKLLQRARLIMTDSGGIQQEATVMDIPCLTLRNTTERPVTVKKGTNLIVGLNKARALKAVNDILAGRWKKAEPIPEWDGKAAEKITKIILRQQENICLKG
ncbi:MAG: UDP-N-acetylglucosamine 2-epimerase (non-hydrolyzing) [Candidatus Omnitrophica bacterium]|nr:UDP-N-acetylglucosamine 2-epimerase (non-hydrolyzing) [Candidatus Omnitrophota bacterium]